MKGLVHIYTGDGKGKTTACIGLAIRALGHGRKVLFAQFLKSSDTGEKIIFENIGKNLTFYRPKLMHKGFVWKMSDEQIRAIKLDIENAWIWVKERIMSGIYDVVVADELLGALSYGFVDINDLIGTIRTKPEHVELVISGRDAPPKIIEEAQYVSDIKAVKHPFNQGIKARKGIEF